MKGRNQPIVKAARRVQGMSKMCLRCPPNMLKRKACDPFGVIYKASKVLKYSVLRSRITIR